MADYLNKGIPIINHICYTA